MPALPETAKLMRLCCATSYRFSVVVVAIGCVVLVGWALDLELLKSVLTGRVTMKPNTALGLILSGAGLWLWHRQGAVQTSKSKRQLSGLMLTVAGLTILLGVLTLIEYGFGIDLWIDQLLFHDSADAVDAAAKGRMAPNTAFNFVCVGSALALLMRQLYRPAQAFSLLVFANALLALTGHLYAVTTFYSGGSVTGMAVHTAIAFFLLALGILFATADKGWMQSLSSPQLGGITARRLLPVVITVPLILGLFVLFLYDRFHLSPVSAIALRSILEVVLFTIILWWNAQSLNQLDAHRLQTQQQLGQSEQRYKAIVEDQTELIARFLPDTTLVFVNEAFCRFFGVQPKDVVGQSYQPVIYQADLDRVTQFMQSMNAGNPTGMIENRVINAEGEVRWTQWVNRMLFDAHGNLMEIQAVGRDITDLKQAETALRRSEERWQFALEGSGDGVWDWDLPTNTLFYSPRWKAMLGYADLEISNTLREWEDRIHPDDKAAALIATEQLLRGEIQHFTQKYRFRHKDGSYLWILDRAQIVSRTPEGQPLRVIGTHSDITLLKQAEVELKRSQISRSLVGDMLRDLQSRGNLSDTAMFQAGKELAGRVYGKTLDEFLDAFAAMGLGTLALTETKPNRWTFTGDKLVSVDIGQHDQPTCHYPRGYLCGAIAQLAQTPGQIAAVEMQCQSMHDPLCVFVVQVMT